MEKNTRLQKAVNYLKGKGLVKTQKDIAEKMKTSEPNVSNALRGIQNFISDSFLIRFNNSFDNLFNNEWLLTGEGEMLANQEKIAHTEEPLDNTSPPASQELYRLCLEMAKEIKETNERCQKLTEDAKETHKMAVNILNTASNMMTVAYGVSEAIRKDRENIQELFYTLRDSRQKDFDANMKFLEERKATFSTWVEEQKALISTLSKDFAAKLLEQNKATRKNVNSSTQKIVKASTSKILSTCRQADLSALTSNVNDISLCVNLIKLYILGQFEAKE